MAIRIHLGNVLDAHADALLLTIDGARKGLEGNIARAFSRRWPDAFDEVSDQVPYPLRLGRAVLTRTESDCPFQVVLIASTLHHVDVFSDTEKARVIAAALQEAIGLARRHGLRSLASAVMTGGWRLPFEAALRTMLATAGFLVHGDSALELLVVVRTEAEYASTMAIADDMGVGVLSGLTAPGAGHTPKPQGS